MTEPSATPATSALTPTTEWMDLYGSLYLDGKPVAAGTEVSAVDDDGVVCGATTVRDDGRYGFLHVYSDDPRTELDEGAEVGERLRFLIDGIEPGLAPAAAWSGGKTVVRLDLKLSSGPNGVAMDRPLRFALDDARPNPFNPSTAIGYELPADGPVRMAVYDPLGRQVRLLVDRIHAAGHHVAVWDGTDSQGRDAASGMYVIRIVTEHGTLASRVVLLR